MGPATLAPGETIVSIGASGGGYGPPYEREAWRVLKDITEGWISRERAEKVYGVAINETGEVDDKATRAFRAPVAHESKSMGGQAQVGKEITLTA
jgi:N-methylhydantoinase B